MSRITIKIIIEDGKVTVDQEIPEEEKPFLLHTDEELEIPDRAVTTDESAVDIIKENNERFTRQFADKLASDPITGPHIPLVTDADLQAVEQEAIKNDN